MGQTLKLNNVIEYYSLEKSDFGPAIVMEDFGGSSLGRLQKEQRFSLIDALKIGTVIANTLGNIHLQGVIHKDINPDNIVLNVSNEKIKIIDFEISTRMAREKQEPINPDRLEGTLAYISPEQTGRMNRPVDYRTDFYSLGITLYEILLGRRPFESDDGMELVHSHIALLPPPLAELDDSIPTAVSAIVERLMAKNAEDRYKSGFGLEVDLAFCLEHIERGQEIKNFVPGLNDHSDRFSIPVKIYGRQNEIDTLNKAFERIARGNLEIMLFEGPGGIGKSVLINELQRRLGDRRGFFISGKFDQFKRNIPYASLIQAFRDLIRRLLTESTLKISL